MKQNLYKIHIFITILYLGVGLIMGLGFEAIGMANNNTSFEIRWVIYPLVTVAIVLGINLLRLSNIATKLDLIQF